MRMEFLCTAIFAFETCFGCWLFASPFLLSRLPILVKRFYSQCLEREIN